MCRVRLAVAACLCAGAAPSANADVLYLKNGGSVEGEILQSEDGRYRVRTVVGAVTIAATEVQRIEATPSPFAEYEQRHAHTPHTAEAHAALAAWCSENGLNSERLRHLRRAIALDPNFAPARRQLGFVRIGGMWVDGRTVLERTGEETAPTEDGPADAENLEEAIRASWSRRVRAIKTALLDSGLDRSVEQGRARILGITDPLAVPALAHELSRGSALCRSLLVEALSAIEHDEATMNLAILALLDPLNPIREAALEEIARRDDPRTVPQYRQALKTRNETILLRAAEGLGRLNAVEAIPELMDALTRRRMKTFEYYPDAFLQGVHAAYGVPVRSGGRIVTQVAQHPQIGLPDSPMHDGLRPRRVRREVTVYRTEVLEALRQITGRDFGFDREAWRQWYQQEYRS